MLMFCGGPGAGAHVLALPVTEIRSGVVEPGSCVRPRAGLLPFCQEASKTFVGANITHVSSPLSFVGAAFPGGGAYGVFMSERLLFVWLRQWGFVGVM